MDLRDVKEFLKDTFKYIVTIVIVLIIFLYGVSIQQIVGPSMSPTYQDEEVVLLKKFYYKIFNVERFDVVSLKHDGTKYLIKRVIALPGETIEYKENKLYIDEKYVEEKFLKDVNTTDFGPITLKDDEYFVLGDNRENSSDSRTYGTFNKSDFIGKVNLRIWPLNKVKYIK